MRARYRSFAVIRCRSNRLNGCVPAEPTRSAFLACDAGDVRAQRDELPLDVARGAAHRRRDLEDRLHELGIDPRLQLVPAHGGEHRVDVLDELESLSVEELVLLLDSEGVRVARAELVVDDAACRLRPVAGDRGTGTLAWLASVTAARPRPRSRPSTRDRRAPRGRSCWPVGRSRRPPRARGRSRRSQPDR